jgi:putative flavoprotein involved in K+ transport
VIDLASLAARGVRVTGRALDADGARVTLSSDLCETTRAADAKLSRLLDRIDAFVERSALSAGPRERPRPVVLPPGAPVLDLRAERIASVVFATGFRRRYPWLHVPVLDDDGEVVHTGGVTSSPGLYVLGLQFLRRRSSSFLDGVGADAAHLAEHIALRSDGDARHAA